LLTQLSVMSFSIIGSLSSSSYVSENGSSTMPSTSSRHDEASTRGITSAVSTR
jgi:hypothetical protein